MARIPCAVWLATALFAISPTFAQSTEITYQGEVRDGGVPASGPHDFTFRVFDAITGGTQYGPTLCTDNTAVDQGRFTVGLDFGPIYDGRPKYLEIEVRSDTGLSCGDASGWTLLRPRTLITASPFSTFAFTAANATSASVASFASTAGSASSADDASSFNGQPPSFYQNAGGLNTGTLPGARLAGTYANALLLTNAGNVFTGSGAALTALNASNITTGTLSNSRLSVPLNVSGSSTFGSIVRSVNTATTGTASYGVYGETNSTTGHGGVIGVAGNDSSTSSAWAVYGITSGPTGRGVNGRAFFLGSDVSYGVFGDTDSTNPAAYGVYASGPLGASGTKSFRIDHPDDPTGKYLLHYSVESPEVLNTYSGIVPLDDAGEATVELPAYFAKINKDPRYTLTAIGASMPALYIAAEIDAAALKAGEAALPTEAAPLCTFRIAGGAPGAKVSWRIEAVRNDLWMRLRGAPVEVNKEGPEANTYQHPEFYGQPEERSMNYEPRPK